MTGAPRRGGGEPDRPVGGGYPGYPGYPAQPDHQDPAYANQSPYGPTYPGPAPTQKLPQYSPYGYDDPYRAGQYPPQDPAEPPGGGKSPQWLWWLAAAAVLVVVALVIALVISNSSRQQTVVAPAPALPEPTSTSTTRTPTTTSPTPTPAVPPSTTAPGTTPSTTASGQTETVTYDVAGDGRAISITYTDSGGLPQTEFNVQLPWSRTVELAAPAQNSARISIINLGAEVTCTVAINGSTTEQRTGAGLTICAGLG